MQDELFFVRTKRKRVSHRMEPTPVHERCPFCHASTAERIDRDGDWIIFHCPACELEFATDAADAEKLLGKRRKNKIGYYATTTLVILRQNCHNFI